MSDEQQAKPSFTHAVAKKALAPIVASIATAATTYLMRKGQQVWHETVRPKVDEKGGPEALARQAVGAVSSKLAPAAESIGSTVSGEPEAPPQQRGGSGDEQGDQDEERRKRAQRRQQRRRALDQAGSS